MKRAALTGAVIGILAVAAAGCGGYGKSKSGSGSGKTNIAGVAANDHGSKTVSGATKVELYDYYFEPTVLKGNPGQKVTLDLKNEGKVQHTFTVDSQGIDQALQPGKDAKVTVTIPKSGAVSFYCRFHRSSGMAGALVANGSSPSSGSGNGSTGTSTGGGYGGSYGG